MRAQAGDINTKGAYNGTSMDPERRERQDVADYLSHMREVQNELEAENRRLNAELAECKSGRQGAAKIAAKYIMECVKRGDDIEQLRHTIGRLVAVGEDALHLLEALYSGDQVIWDTKSMTREDDEC